MVYLVWFHQQKHSQNSEEDGNQSLKKNISFIDGVAAFSDDLRDGIKGSVFEAMETGFVSGSTGLEESIKFGIVASTNHPQINYSLVNYSGCFHQRYHLLLL